MAHTRRMKAVLQLALLLVTSSSIRAVQVFYVGSATECSSADNSPCHSLQYYANNSNFTNNSIFHFLQGQHHLETVITIRNVVNLTLVGASSGVKILCNSPQSGLTVEEFRFLAIENLTFSECSHKPNVSAIFLDTGSELSLNRVTISKSSLGRSEYTYTGLSVNNVTGSFSIRNSTFYTSKSTSITVLYPLSNRPSNFEFCANKVSHFAKGLILRVETPNVHMIIANSTFEDKDHTINPGEEVSLKVSFIEAAGSSIRINNGIMGNMLFSYCHDDLSCNLDCSSFSSEVSGVTSDAIGITGGGGDCPTVIKDSEIKTVQVKNAPGTSILNATSAAVQLYNVIIGNGIFGTIFINSTISFVNCTIKNAVNSGVYASTHSHVLFQGNNTFQNLSALVGGGMHFVSSSYVHLLPHTTLLFVDNRAEYVGGAIYIEPDKQDLCFYDNNASLSLNETVKMVFINNTAGYGGSILYGDGFDQCASYDEVINVSNTEADPSAVAGEPYDVCFCEFGKLQPNCLTKSFTARAFPGQDFTIRLAVVSNFAKGGAGVVPGAIRAYFMNGTSNTLFDDNQISQASDVPHCKNFSYSLKSKQREVKFQLSSEQSFFKALYLTLPGISSGPWKLSVQVYLDGCPLGFNLSSTGECECDHILLHQQVECDINNQSFLIPDNSWIGFINETLSSNVTGTGVIFHSNCPFGYCLPHNVSITSSTGDDQCEPHRTGLLCGKCQEGYSLTLGSEKCAKCSNVYLLLIIPLAVSGLFLVGVLFVLNLTVTEGSINGLIFYANVIAMSRVALILKETSYLYMFLAWLNLDLGIGTCLFNGMDGYTATWLQFVFPVYLWMIILAIVLFYRKFPRLGRRMGQENAVKVLATLFLLSYTKLQRTVVTIGSFTTLEYPSGEVRYVWLHDTNIEFFKGKHLYLGVAGILVLVFLIVPYTLCLAFFQQLQACSGHRLFRWVNRLKPLFDSYTGPYKDKYRFWTGMLLVVRTVLIVVFTVNVAGSVEFDLLVILVVSSALAWAHSNAICKKWPHNYLEAFFHLQLVVFAASMLYARCSHGNTAIVAYTSIGLSLVVFLAVIGYHIWRRVASFKNHHNCNGYADIDADNDNLDSFAHKR